MVRVLNRVCSDGKKFIHRPPNKSLDPRYVRKTLEHDRRKVLVWGCVPWHDIGSSQKNISKMDRFIYIDIIKDVMQPFANDNLPRIS